MSAHDHDEVIDIAVGVGFALVEGWSAAQAAGEDLSGVEEVDTYRYLRYTANSTTPIALVTFSKKRFGWWQRREAAIYWCLRSTYSHRDIYRPDFELACRWALNKVWNDDLNAKSRARLSELGPPAI